MKHRLEIMEDEMKGIWDAVSSTRRNPAQFVTPLPVPCTSLALKWKPVAVDVPIHRTEKHPVVAHAEPGGPREAGVYQASFVIVATLAAQRKALPLATTLLMFFLR